MLGGHLKTWFTLLICSSAHSSPKPLCNRSTSQNWYHQPWWAQAPSLPWKNTWATPLATCSSVLWNEWNVIFLTVSAGPNPENSYTCVELSLGPPVPAVPGGIPGKLKDCAQGHTDAECCFANQRELCMFRAAERGGRKRVGFFFFFFPADLSKSVIRWWIFISM